MQTSQVNHFKIYSAKFYVAEIYFYFFFAILTFLAARSCESSRAPAPPRLMVTGHPSLALTPLGTGSTIGPRKAGWVVNVHMQSHTVTLHLCSKHLYSPRSFRCNFLCPVHTYVCHTWLPSSLARTHSGPSPGGNSYYGRSRNCARSPLQRIP